MPVDAPNIPANSVAGGPAYGDSRVAAGVDTDLILDILVLYTPEALLAAGR
jgi:hypothetical protein